MRILSPKLALVGLAVVSAAPAPGQDLTELARRATDSVVALSVSDAVGREVGRGTAFFVDSGHLVTNLHVVEGAHRVEARLADRSTLPIVGVLASDEVNDLAILKTEGITAPGLPLSRRSPPSPGERIVVLGNPLGLSSTLSEGIVSAVREEGLETSRRAGFSVPLLQISAAISPGSSGSPVMDLDGEVVGVAVSQYLVGQNLNFAVPVVAVRQLLDGVRPDRLEASFGEVASFAAGAYLRNVGISLLFFAGIFYLLRRLSRLERGRRH